jgi:hypothetical protein
MVVGVSKEASMRQQVSVSSRLATLQPSLKPHKIMGKATGAKRLSVWQQGAGCAVAVGGAVPTATMASRGTPGCTLPMARSHLSVKSVEAVCGEVFMQDFRDVTEKCTQRKSPDLETNRQSALVFRNVIISLVAITDH